MPKSYEQIRREVHDAIDYAAEQPASVTAVTLPTTPNPYLRSLSGLPLDTVADFGDCPPLQPHDIWGRSKQEFFLMYRALNEGRDRPIPPWLIEATWNHESMHFDTLEAAGYSDVRTGTTLQYRDGQIEPRAYCWASGPTKPITIAQFAATYAAPYTPSDIDTYHLTELGTTKQEIQLHFWHKFKGGDYTGNPYAFIGARYLWLLAQ